MKIRTLLKIPAGLSAAEHERAWNLLCSEQLDGLELSSFGGAFGPVWDPQGSYDLDFLRHYPELTELHVGVRLRSLAGIGLVANGLRELTLSNPPGRDYVIDLEPLVACQALRCFSSAWRDLDYGRLSEIRQLRDLGLTGGGVERLAISASLPELRRLDVSFGSARSLRGLEQLEHLEHFSALRVRGLADLSSLEATRNLRTLELDSLKQVRALPDLSRHEALTTVKCLHMNGLEDLQGLAGSGVRELALVGCGKLGSAAFAPLAGKLPRLERVVLSLARKNDEADARKHFASSQLAASTNEFERYFAAYTRTEYRAFA